jgi:serine/threonine protein kinase
MRSNDSGDQSFHANLEKVQQWTSSVSSSFLSLGNFNTGTSTLISIRIMDLVTRMLELKPTARPTTKQILGYFATLSYSSVFKSRNCCESSPEPYTVYTKTDWTIHRDERF